MNFREAIHPNIFVKPFDTVRYGSVRRWCTLQRVQWRGSIANSPATHYVLLAARDIICAVALFTNQRTCSFTGFDILVKYTKYDQDLYFSGLLCMDPK